MEQIAGRFRLYSLLQEYFQDNCLTAQLTEELWSISAQVLEDTQEAAAAIQLLRQALRQPEPEAEYEYNALFVGPRKLLAPPYESCYRSPERTLMQRETLAVRNFYAKAGLECECKNSMPDDHMAIELEFICYLHAKAGRFKENGMADQAGLYLELYREFFAIHVRHWLPAHCQDVLQHAKTALCRGVALLLLEFFRQEEQRLQLSKEGFTWTTNIPTQDEHLLKAPQDQLLL